MDTIDPLWKGKNHNHRKIDPHDVLLIRELRKEGLKVQDIANKFELTKSHISKIINMKVWAHI